MSKDMIGAARQCWEKALALNSTSAALNAMIGWTYCLDARFGWREDRTTALSKAGAYLKSALHNDPNNADALIFSANLSGIKGCFDELVIDSHRAVELAPNSADVVNLASFGLTAGGRPEEAIRHSRKAMELNPNYPAVYLGNLGFAYRLAGCIEESHRDVQSLRRSDPR